MNECKSLLPATGQLWEGLGGVITGKEEHHLDNNQNIIVYLSPTGAARYNNMIKTAN